MSDFPNTQENHVSQTTPALNRQTNGNNNHVLDCSAQSAPTTPPKTLQRVAHNRTANARVHIAQESATKTKSKAKHRSKHTTTYPAVHSTDRNTPPFTGQSTITQSARPISTPSAAAYAGPTFHASPAPSALPIPSFYSKSVPETSGISALSKARKEDIPAGSSQSPTAAATTTTAVAPSREESPLDFIFNAHREESRARSSPRSGGPYDLPLKSPPNSSVTPVSEGHGAMRSSHFSGGPSSSMFAMELDDNASPGKPYGPAFSTPYSARISAARSGAPANDQTSKAATGDRSQALKDFLFSQSPKQVASKPLSFADIPKQSVVESQTSTTPLRAQRNSLPRQQDGVAHTIPRAAVRSSGLRREMEITPTRITPEFLNDSNRPYYEQPITPSRPSRGTPQSHTFSENVSSNYTAQQSEPSPSRAPTSSGNRDLRGMEDSLRRMLKLEPSPDAASQGQSGGSGKGRLGKLPAATASVPSYVGGRTPPLNGLHNGVMGS